jgi:hypothetical protein
MLFQGQGGYLGGALTGVQLALLPLKPLREDEYSNWIAQAMPDVFSNLDHPDHSEFLPPAVKAWFDARPFRDPVTNVEWGGPGGVQLSYFLLLKMLVHVQSPDNQLQDSPTASPTLIPTSIVQYTHRALMVFTNHLNESIKTLEGSVTARTLATNQNVKFLPMHPDQAWYKDAISPIDMESDAITISSRGPPDPAANLLEPVRSPCRITSTPNLGARPGTGNVEVSRASPKSTVTHASYHRSKQLYTL